jgi:hypothetical protein
VPSLSATAGFHPAVVCSKGALVETVRMCEEWQVELNGAASDKNLRQVLSTIFVHIFAASFKEVEIVHD